ncbi:MAG TPA: metalloregulator ArsR/SmtB family transcription factor [Casimicrobiaceae bacterium]|jgi:DNA-binding transcriptional ArsR family regulator|nr:metalloregulator ArsR/SmtB family transcription factor [Casimicrobiaceae bacterium]
MESKTAVQALGALAQETRLAIFRMLVQQGPAGLSAGSIGDSLKLAPATLSFHLRELSQAGLVRARQQSRFIYYSADFSAMNALLGYLAENCCRASSAPGDDATCPSPCMPSELGRIAPSDPKPVVHPKWRVA